MVRVQGFQFYIGVDMMLGTFWAFMTPEGYLVRAAAAGRKTG